MLSNIHEVSIIVNGEKADIYSMEKLNLRINNVVLGQVVLKNKQNKKPKYEPNLYAASLEPLNLNLYFMRITQVC